MQLLAWSTVGGAGYYGLISILINSINTYHLQERLEGGWFFLFVCNHYYLKLVIIL